MGAVLVAAGFADFPLIAYHFAQASTVSGTLIPVFYAVAMGMGGIGSLVFGRLFDRVGIAVLVPLTLLSALFSCSYSCYRICLDQGVYESITPGDANLMEAYLRWANLQGALLQRADLKEADLSDAHLEGAIWRRLTCERL